METIIWSVVLSYRQALVVISTVERYVCF